MPWIFTPLLIEDGTLKTSPATVDMVLPVGNVKQVAIYLPSTTNAHQAGVRINSPRGLIFPTRVEGSDDWIYSQTIVYHDKIFPTNIDLGGNAPIYITVEGFNVDSTDKYAQVGIYVEPFHTEVDNMLHNILVAIEALKQADKQPDIEKQIRRLFTILAGGGDNGTN